MPLGEDIPILIPISIVLVVFILSLFTLYSNFSDRTEIVEMSQKSLNIAEYIIANKEIIEFSNGYCRNVNEWNISSNYKVYITVMKIEDNSFSCWGNIKNSNTVVTNSLPFLIEDDLAKVVVSIGK